MNKFLLVTILFCNSLIAQDFKITKVQVKDSFKATIPDSERLNENARFADTLKDNRSQDYKFLDFEIDPKYSTKLLKPAKIKSEKIDRLYKNYVGLATGYRSGFSSEYLQRTGLFPRDWSTLARGRCGQCAWPCTGYPWTPSA